MRKIKFRLWCQNKNEWESDKWIIDSRGNIFDVTDREWYPMKRETHILEQFIGLKDENDNEIWEGDIVETRMNHHGKPLTHMFHSIIRYNENVGCWQISYKNIDDKFVYDNIGFRYFLKVVGNIHENKELLQ